MDCIHCGKPNIRPRVRKKKMCNACYEKFEEERSNSYYIRTYGIDLANYNKMFEEQRGLCAACGLPETSIDPVTKQTRRFCVDHCHETGRVRGLLCNSCNAAYGLLKDDPIRVAGLLTYALKQEIETSRHQVETLKAQIAKVPGATTPEATAKKRSGRQKKCVIDEIDIEQALINLQSYRPRK